MTSTAVLRKLVETAAAAYELRLEPFEGGTLVGLSDGEARDWFIVRDCGHISTIYTNTTRALASSCPVCEEVRISEMHAQHVLNRLSHVKVLLEGKPS